jgi:histidinol-phosphate/aromatic aminotransferase/cobyric acid decarboxylase-like protein
MTHQKSKPKEKHMKPQDLQTIARAALMPPAAPTAAQAIAAKVDRLGVLHAALADMKREADQLRTELEDAGLDSIEGHLYRVNFAQCAGRALTDWKTIAERLKPSPQLVRAHTTTGDPSTRMTVKARQTH